MGEEDGSREKSQRLGPQKQVETQCQNRVTDTQRKPDLTMLTRNRGRDEVGWRDRQLEYQREQRKRQVEGESELFFLLAFTQEAVGPGRCYEEWSQVGVSKWVLVGKAQSVNVDTH